VSSDEVTLMAPDRELSESLSDEELVRLLLQELGEVSTSYVCQVAYLLQCLGFKRRFRFTYEPFLGVRAQRLEGLVQSARMNLLLERNGIPPERTHEVREFVQRLRSALPAAEPDIRLVALAAFASFKGWSSREPNEISEVVERAAPSAAPDAKITPGEAVRYLDDLSIRAA
jgi:hypothetical protein